ncbi:MAG: T9SS type A sorting domain-containing protein [Calditrichaeota bacterium]|nr:T9SS type A sorting domain-containing protein [Calditrichota bacterium]
MKIKIFLVLAMSFLLALSHNFALGKTVTHATQSAGLDDYRVEPIPKMMTPLTGETTEIFGPNTFWEISPAINLPFPFIYANKTYNQIKVSSNGFLTFDVSTNYHYLTNNLGASSPKNVLAPLWDYLNVSSSGKVHYQTSGETPNRMFVIEFKQIVWGPFSSPKVDFQIVLFEGSNDIEFHYGTMDNAGFGADGASIGINDAQGNFINALDGSRDVPQNEILEPPTTNFRFTTSPAPEKDVGISDIIVSPDWFVNRADTIQVIVENHGSKEQTGFSVAYQIGDETPIQENFTASLSPGSKATMTFNTLWTPKQSGLFSVNAWTELTSDANTLNDTLSVKDAVQVYEVELPAPTNVAGSLSDENQIVLSWTAGNFQNPLPGEWNGKTSEGQNVRMIINYNSTKVDSCEIYYTVYGDPFPFPLQNYSKVQIHNNSFSFYYSDQYGLMSTDVQGTFVPPDSCQGTWRAGVYVNNVYTVFSGTWQATANFLPPKLLGFQIYRDVNPNVQAISENLITEIDDPNVGKYIDSLITPDTRYYYIVASKYDYGSSLPSNEISMIVTAVNDLSFSQIHDYRLCEAFPNPFNPSATIRFEIPKAADVKISIFDVLGHKIKILASDKFQPGSHAIRWDGKDNRGVAAASGTYLVRMQTKEFSAAKKILLLK